MKECDACEKEFDPEENETVSDETRSNGGRLTVCPHCDKEQSF